MYLPSRDPTFGVIVGHILLELAMQLLVAVVYEEVCQVLLFDKVTDTLPFIFGKGFIIIV
jgi:hypothetical protein